MPARTPAEVEILGIEAVNNGDVEGFIELCEPGATIVTPSGQVLEGHEDIRRAVSILVSMTDKATTEVYKVLEAGDTALLHARWTLAGSLPDGKPYRAEGDSAHVVRRQPDGTYKVVIINRPGAGDPAR